MHLSRTWKKIIKCVEKVYKDTKEWVQGATTDTSNFIVNIVIDINEYVINPVISFLKLYWEVYMDQIFNNTFVSSTAGGTYLITNYHHSRNFIHWLNDNSLWAVGMANFLFGITLNRGNCITNFVCAWLYNYYNIICASNNRTRTSNR